MGQYGRAAVSAADLLQAGLASSPRSAWDAAMRRVTQSPSSRGKPCPRSTFLGLCEAGEVRGVAPGQYTRSPDNKVYAVRALDVLRARPSLASDPAALWAAATEGTAKAHNGQMDVLLTLWQAGLISDLPSGR